MQKSRSATRAGLTLLELVMVVAVLAILTALVVPGLTDQQEHTRTIVTRATLQELRDVVANRYLPDMQQLPQPNRLYDLSSRVSQTQADGTIPQLHFLFVNPNQYASASNPPYASVSDFDSQTRIGWNGPYIGTKPATYPDPTARRFQIDPNNLLTWADYGFTALFGQKGDFVLMDPWGSPYVIYVLPSVHGGSTMYASYVVSAGPNRKLDMASWSVNTDGTLNTLDDLALLIRAQK